MYRRFTPDDSAPVARLHADAFGNPVDSALAWQEKAGTSGFRVVEHDNRVVATLLDIPMGMFFGGRSVRTHGVAGVTVDLTERGKGLAGQMMRDYLRELATGSVALSALYASTRALYRSVGYGVAGNRFIATLPTETLRGVGTRSSAWSELEDWGPVEAAYARWSIRDSGTLDRPKYIWDRVRGRYDKTNRAWVLGRPDDPDAWVVVYQKHRGDWIHVEVHDYGARDAKALRHVAGFLGGFASMARTVELPFGGGHEPLLDLMPEFRADIRLQEPWMLRIVDIRHAFEQRGWPTHLSAVLQLEVSDPVLRDNNGRFTVRISNGEARVTSGSDGTIRVDIDALASLYTGHAGPRRMMLQGGLQTDEAGVDDLISVFAGPTPALADFF